MDRHVYFQLVSEEKKQAILNTLVNLPFFRIRDKAKSNIDVADQRIELRKVVFFESSEGEIRVRGERDPVPPEEEERIAKIRENLFSELKHEQFAPSAVNWGKLILLPEVGANASLINILFGPKQNPEDKSGRLMWNC